MAADPARPTLRDELAAYNAARLLPFLRYAQGRQGRGELARTILPIPSPNDTMQQAARFEHSDLPCLDARELWQETERARLALILSDVPDPWVLDRLNACQAEQAARQKVGAS